MHADARQSRDRGVAFLLKNHLRHAHTIMDREEPILGAALEERTAGLSDAASLGPPDLCYLFKTFEPRRNKIVGGLLGAEESAQPSVASPHGFYHHVLGLDVSSPAPVATYVAELAATEQATSQTSWLASGSWRVSGGVYACWDTFRRQDLRVRVSIPGGVHDIIEGAGENQTVFSVDGIPHPALVNGSYLLDTVGVDAKDKHGGTVLMRAALGGQRLRLRRPLAGRRALRRRPPLRSALSELAEALARSAPPWRTLTVRLARRDP